MIPDVSISSASYLLLLLYAPRANLTASEAQDKPARDEMHVDDAEVMHAPPAPVLPEESGMSLAGGGPP